jgi:hypothetical protein
LRFKLFFHNFVPEKPENKGEGISPNYNNPQKRFCPSRSQAILEWVAWFPLFSVGFIDWLGRTGVTPELSQFPESPVIKSVEWQDSEICQLRKSR